MNKSLQKKLIKEVRLRPIIWDKRKKDHKSYLKRLEEWTVIAENLGQPVQPLKNKWKNLRDTFKKELNKISSRRSDDPKCPDIYDYTGTWRHFSNLYFLKDAIESDEPETDNGTNEESEEIDEVPIIDLSDDLLGNSLQSWSYQEFENINLPENGQILIAGEEVELLPEIISESGSDEDNRTKENNSNMKDSQQQILEIEEVKTLACKKKNKLESEDEDILFVKSLVPYLKKIEPIRKLRLKSKIQNLIADEMSANIGSRASNEGSSLKNREGIDRPP